MFAQHLKTSSPSDQTVVLEDQTLREAFQVHPRAVPLEDRLAVLQELIRAGMRRCQVGSLVRSDIMPQMADIEQLYGHIAGIQGLEAWVMVFNRKGLERAVAAGISHVAFSASLSEIHCKTNLGCGVDPALSRCLDLAAKALAHNMKVRMGLQCAYGGPMLPPPAPKILLYLLEPFHGIGVRRLALCDTAGRATPSSLRDSLSVLRQGLPGAELGLHLHGLPDRLSANLATAYEQEVDWLDVSLNGRGGCPFLPGSPPGNLSTLSAVEFLANQGLNTGLDIDCLLRASALLEKILAEACNYSVHNKIPK
jgi:hydroxymethylglutaryl-CoA lyase